MFKIKLLILAVVVFCGAQAGASEQIWQEVSATNARGVTAYQRHYQLDSPALRATLQNVTLAGGPGSVRFISLPMPDGSLAVFEIHESPIMQEGLAQRYPGIKTYKVRGIDDPIATGRIDITPRGFHAMLHTSQGRLFIDPHSGSQQPDRYLARTRNAASSSGRSCSVIEPRLSADLPPGPAARSAARIPGSLLQYRLAVSATEEYVNAIPGRTIADAQSEIITAINRVNVIYERDLGIRLMLVDDNQLLIENGNNVDFSNDDNTRLISENQVWIDSVITSSKYDVGHVFSSGSGGLAELGSVCADGSKARGVSGIFDPTGDPFYIDFVAHEIGHQFNADHSFNGSSVSCLSGRNPATAFEPGSGSTIMAYAGICGVEDLQLNSDATFHAGSIDQVNNFTAGAGSCSSLIPAVNLNVPAGNLNEPQINDIADRTIPANTPFVLDGSASDADGDTLLYQWDQMDVGCPTDASSFGTDTGFNGLFRSYQPRTESERHFPALGTQLQGLYDDAEVLPCNNRDINLRFTARDGFSGQDTDDVKITVRDTGAAFEITNLNDGQEITSPESFTVNWRVAGTTAAPISCASVDIDLLTFNAALTTYSVHPLQTALNDGSADVSIVPATSSHPRALIRVACSNNVFYDISNAPFRIIGTGTDFFKDNEIDVFYNDNGTTGAVAPACGAIAECRIPDSGAPGFDGSGSGDASAVDYRWLLLLAGLLVFARTRRARSA